MKAKVKETGEIIDVNPIFEFASGEFICYQSGDCVKGDLKSYSKYELDFNTDKKKFSTKDFYQGCTIIENSIDWEQRRYEIAKEALNGFLASSNPDRLIDVRKYTSTSVELADSLIEQLKK